MGRLCQRAIFKMFNKSTNARFGVNVEFGNPPGFQNFRHCRRMAFHHIVTQARLVYRTKTDSQAV